MKQCPKCQQTFPDNAPDFCPNDGTQMMTAAPQQQYAPGANYQQPYGAPPTPPQQNWPPPNPGIPGGGYQPQAAHAPYAPHVAKSGGGLGKAAMWSGLVSLFLTIALFTLVGLTKGSDYDINTIGKIIYIVMVLAGIIGLVLGIISLVKRGESKGKGIVGICASLPALAFFAYIIIDRGVIIG